MRFLHLALVVLCTSLLGGSAIGQCINGQFFPQQAYTLGGYPSTWAAPVAYGLPAVPHVVWYYYPHAAVFEVRDTAYYPTQLPPSYQWQPQQQSATPRRFQASVTLSRQGRR